MKYNLNIVQNFESYSYMELQKLHLKIETLEVLYNNTETFINKYLEDEIRLITDKEINDKGHNDYTEEKLQIITQSISSLYGITVESRDVLSQYMIVATFSYYEKSFKNILSLTSKLTDIQLKDCYKNHVAKSILMSKFSIQYDKLRDNKTLQELRCLNNAIKHSGKVSKELNASNKKWKVGNYLDDNLFDDFKRLKSAPFNLLEDLHHKIK